MAQPIPHTPAASGAHGTPAARATLGTLPAFLQRLAPALLAAGLGLVLLFGVGLAQSQLVHSAAHDARHATGFPCH